MEPDVCAPAIVTTSIPIKQRKAIIGAKITIFENCDSAFLSAKRKLAYNFYMFKFGVCFLLSFTALQAASIVSSAQCYADNGPGVKSTLTCESNGFHQYPPGSSFPSAQRAVVMNGIYSNVVTSTGFSASFGGSASATRAASARSDINYSITVLTAGPVRTGIIRGDFRRSYTLNGALVDFGYDFPNRPPYEELSPAAPPIYITLGQPFTFTSFLTVQSPYYGQDVDAGGVSLLQNFNFYEADGVTLVSIAEAPEPASLLLIISVLPLIALGARQRRS